MFIVVLSSILLRRRLLMSALNAASFLSSSLGAWLTHILEVTDSVWSPAAAAQVPSRTVGALCSRRSGHQQHKNSHYADDDVHCYCRIMEYCLFWHHQHHYHPAVARSVTTANTTMASSAAETGGRRAAPAAAATASAASTAIPAARTRIADDYLPCQCCQVSPCGCSQHNQDFTNYAFLLLICNLSGLLPLVPSPQ